MTALIIDCETTGFSYKSRIVSIAWIVLDGHRRLDIQYHLIKCEEIPEASTRIHGITSEYSMTHGICIKKCLKKLKKTLCKYNCTKLVGHNVIYDKTILINELLRYENKYLIRLISKMELFCTMRKAKTILCLEKNPKLVDLHLSLTKQEIPNAHNALADAEACCKCYKILIAKTN